MRRHFSFFPRLRTLAARAWSRRRSMARGAVAAARRPAPARRPARCRALRRRRVRHQPRAAARSSWGGSGERDAMAGRMPRGLRDTRTLVPRRRPDVAGRPCARRLRRRARGRRSPRRRLRAGRLHQGAGRARLRPAGVDVVAEYVEVARGLGRATPRSTTATACPPRTAASTRSSSSRCSSTSRTRPPSCARPARRC